MALVYNEALRKLRPTVYPLAFAEIRTLYARAYGEVRAGKQNATQAIAVIKDQISALLRHPAK